MASALHGSNDYYDIGKESTYEAFSRRLNLYKDCSRLTVSSIGNLPADSFQTISGSLRRIRNDEYSCVFWLSFRLMNSLSSEKTVFFRSYPDPAFHIYKSVDEKWILLDRAENNFIASVTLLPGEKAGFLVRVVPQKHLRENFLYADIRDLINEMKSNPSYFMKVRPDMFFYFMILFTGMAGMMAIYLLLNYLHLRDRSYCLYAFNILCVVSLVVLRLWHDIDPGQNTVYLHVMLQPSLQVGSHLFYFLFASWFLNLKVLLPRLHRFFNFIAWALVIYIICDLLFFFLDASMSLRMQFFFWMRIILIAVAFASIIYAFRKPTTLLRLFAIGTFLMVFSATISFIFSYVPLGKGYGLWSIPYFYFLLGYLIDIVFFTLCLGYKSRLEQRNKIRLERTLMEEKARQQEDRLKLILETQNSERDRLATDLHDEIGSGLSTIRFLSESVKMKGTAIPETLTVISAKSAELIDNMRQIIWSVNPEYDTLSELLLYMKKYCFEYADTNRHDCSFSMPENVPSLILPSGFRQNLFSIFKEVLHNIIKHAKADHIDVQFSLEEQGDSFECLLVISDNGIGITVNAGNSAGNGLKNMNKRIRVLQGSLEISGSTGTVVSIGFSLKK